MIAAPGTPADPAAPAAAVASVPAAPGDAAAPRQEGWREALFNRRMLICVFTGFASGLPLYILINLLPAWLRSEGVNLTTIGLFALIQLPYTWKWLWAPLLDRFAGDGASAGLDGVLAPEAVAAAAVAGMRDERFLIFPHPAVADYYARKAAQPDKWLRQMESLHGRFTDVPKG